MLLNTLCKKFMGNFPMMVFGFCPHAQWTTWGPLKVGQPELNASSFDIKYTILLSSILAQKKWDCRI